MPGKLRALGAEVELRASGEPVGQPVLPDR
jgi:hypothetical protein